MVLVSGISIAHAAPSARKQLEADYALFAHAWKQRDLSPTYRLMTDDFTAMGVSPDGKPIGKAQMVKQTKELLVAKDITWPRKILSLSVQNRKAMAIVEGHFTGTMPARGKGAPRKLELLAKTKDTWVLIGNSWKMQAMEMVSSQMLMNGKPFKRQG